MKAIVYEGPGSVAVRDIADPIPTPGWCVVRVSHAGICGTDLNIFAGTHPRAQAPLVMGHEFSGTVEAGSSRFAKGTRVTVYPLLSCGHCRPCRTGNAHVCTTLRLLGIDRDGGMAQYVAVPEDTLVPLQDSVSYQLGACIEPLAVSVHTLRENGFKPGDNAIVFGCGTIGLCTALLLERFGAGRVSVVESDPSRAEMAKALGLDVLPAAPKELELAVADRTGGDGFDWVFDCAGVQPVADLLFKTVRVQGVIVVVASYKYPASLPLIQGMFKETSIRFVRVYRKDDFRIAADVASQDDRFAGIITHVLPFSEATRGFSLCTTKGSGAVKVLFTFD